MNRHPAVREALAEETDEVKEIALALYDLARRCLPGSMVVRVEPPERGFALMKDYTGIIICAYKIHCNVYFANAETVADPDGITIGRTGNTRLRVESLEDIQRVKFERIIKRHQKLGPSALWVTYFQALEARKADEADKARRAEKARKARKARRAGKAGKS